MHLLHKWSYLFFSILLHAWGSDWLMHKLYIYFIDLYLLNVCHVCHVVFQLQLREAHDASYSVQVSASNPRIMQNNGTSASDPVLWQNKNKSGNKKTVMPSK